MLSKTSPLKLALALFLLHTTAPTLAAAPTSLPPGTLATVNGTPIPQSKLDTAVLASHQPDTPQLRQTLKQELINREVFRQNAEKANYGNRAEVKDIVETTRTNAEIQLYLKDGVHPAPVTDADLQASYDQAVATLGKDEYRASVISVADDATAATVLTQLKGGAAFDALARQYSLAFSKENGGALPWVSFKTPVTEGNTAGLPVAIAQALTQLRAGAITPKPLEVGSLRVIVKLDDKRPMQAPTFDAAKPQIKQRLEALAAQKAVSEFVASQLKQASIQQ
jgi:peptidyl-prolyl cis-trans isomerase C